ncbi:MAG: DUF3107 domain-containing protein [Corynebacterium sp.]|nr:DUF3107 domain-containing protein [Corynebacterium sp.]
MDIKIGLVHSQRELLVSLAGEPDAIKSSLKEALASENEPVLELVDKKGTSRFIRTAEIAYIEFSEEKPHFVGFATK